LPRKQRDTAHRIFTLLQEEGFTGSESTVRAYVGHLRQQQRRPAIFLPLEFDPGHPAPVDWGEAIASINSDRQTVQVFVMTLCYSRRTFVMAFPSQRQEAFLAGHEAAFQFLGGVPHRISYDNLPTAVQAILHGSNRQEQQHFLHFRSHYLFESHFCTPAQGHEKGRVEHRVGFSRRNFFVPIPDVASFAALNAQLRQACERDDQRVVQGTTQAIGADWRQEQPLLRPLPAHPFDYAITRQVRLNPYGILGSDRLSAYNRYPSEWRQRNRSGGAT
jgi:transposase